jgi:methionine biosynthesis protein MetW
MLKYIKSGDKIIDIGCGDGNFLLAAKNLGAIIHGLEVDSSNVASCLSKGLAVVQSDADMDLKHYSDKAFDTAFLINTLQVMKNPKQVLTELLRLADKVVITIPNFGFIKNRYYLGILGKMPMSRTLSYKWYETPNIHFCTITDMKNLITEVGGEIIESAYAPHHILPNLFANSATYVIKLRY